MPDRCPELRALVGAAAVVRSSAPVLVEPTIKVFAPYKQAVWFNHSPKRVWFGDGTSLIEKNYTDEATQKTALRCEEYTGLTATEMVVGKRPYVKGSSTGFFDQPYPRTFIATGGAKNGTVLAAEFASRLLRAL